ncbi:MAG: hypothetical protein ACKO68_00670, partial [Bacteroidota bacterium]
MSDTVKRKNEVVVYGKGLPFAFSDRTSTIQTFDIARNRALPIRSVNEALAYEAIAIAISTAIVVVVVIVIVIVILIVIVIVILIVVVIVI